MGYVLRFIDHCKGRDDAENHDASVLSRAELENAEVVLWKMVQAEEYPGELSTVRKNQQFPLEQAKWL